MSFINLRNERYFPRAFDIPHHSDTKTDLFILNPITVVTDVYKPKAVPEQPARRLRHWCTLAGINYGNSFFDIHDLYLREMDFGLREAGVEMELINLRSNGLLNDPEGGTAAVNAIVKMAIKGTVAVMYTVDLATEKDRHDPEFPTNMLHIPSAASTRVFGCDIDRVLEINDKFHARVKTGRLGYCLRCQQSAASQCVRCKSCYCGPACQKLDWKKHKDECDVITQIRDWSTFDWGGTVRLQEERQVDRACELCLSWNESKCPGDDGL